MTQREKLYHSRKRIKHFIDRNRKFNRNLIDSLQTELHSQMPQNLEKYKQWLDSSPTAEVRQHRKRLALAMMYGRRSSM